MRHTLSGRGTLCIAKSTPVVQRGLGYAPGIPPTSGGCTGAFRRRNKPLRGDFCTTDTHYSKPPAVGRQPPSLGRDRPLGKRSFRAPLQQKRPVIQEQPVRTTRARDRRTRGHTCTPRLLAAAAPGGFALPPTLSRRVGARGVAPPSDGVWGPTATGSFDRCDSTTGPRTAAVTPQYSEYSECSWNTAISAEEHEGCATAAGRAHSVPLCRPALEQGGPP